MTDQWPEKDLFGETITDIGKELGSRESPLKGVKLVTGYPATIGSGPDGETCQTCEFKVRFKMSKVWYKCKKMYDHWSHGAGTDIKMGAPACSYFEKIKD